MEAAFQEVKPGPGKDYLCHPTIKTFLEKASLDPLASDKSKRVNYRRSSASNFERNFELILAKMWFGRGKMVCWDPSQVEAIFRSENVAQRQAATLVHLKCLNSPAQALGRLSLPVLCGWRLRVAAAARIPVPDGD